MELSGILTFFGIFIAILCVLVGIAYYGIRDVTYEDTIKNNPQQTSNEGKKKQKTKQKRDDSDKTKKTTNQTNAKKRNSSATQSSQGEEEEEPIVIIPDPFTNQLSSRFAGASSKKEQGQKSSAPVVEVKKQEAKVNPSTSSVATSKLFDDKMSEQQKLKPKATVKPNQATLSEKEEVVTQVKLTKAAPVLPKVI